MAVRSRVNVENLLQDPAITKIIWYVMVQSTAVSRGIGISKTGTVWL